MARPPLVDEIAAVRLLCREFGLGDVEPVILKAAHHTSLLIAPLEIAARVQSAEPVDMARRRAIRELAVSRHLAGRGAPILAPLDGRLAGPHVIAPSVVSFWPYLADARAADDADAALAATTLAAVHHGLEDYADELPPYTFGLDRCWDALARGHAGNALTQHDRDLLGRHFRRLRQEVETATSTWVPLHGDAHLGNLLLYPRGALWTDFEDACLGPREHDIASLPPAAWNHFAGADQTLIRGLADLKSVCVAIWCSGDIDRSEAVREAAEYHLAGVRRWP